MPMIDPCSVPDKDEYMQDRTVEVEACSFGGCTRLSDRLHLRSVNGYLAWLWTCSAHTDANLMLERWHCDKLRQHD